MAGSARSSTGACRCGGSTPAVTGVTSGGDSIDCLPPDNSFDADIYFYRAWIQNQGGGDLASTHCGTIPQIGETGATVFAASGTLDPTTPEGHHAFTMPPGTYDLRIALNAIDDGFSNFDLYVKAGNPPTPTSVDQTTTLTAWKPAATTSAAVREAAGT